MIVPHLIKPRSNYFFLNTNLLLVATLLSFQLCKSQNLVNNPSFENYSQCPNNYNQVNFANGWFKSLINNNPAYHSEYLNACGTSNFSVPNNTWGYQVAANGVAYMATVTTAPSVQQDYRENIYTSLTSPLLVGQTYSVSFKISHTDNSMYSSDNFGVKFAINTNFPINNISQLYSSNIVTDVTNWTTITGTFIADSAYSYMAIGNFFTDVNTSSITSCSSCSFNLYGYFVDDLDVHQINALALSSNFSCSDTTICLTDTIKFNNLSVGATVYSWNFGDVQGSSLVSPYHVYQAPGTYHVTLLSSNGSTSSTSSLNVTVLPKPVLTVLGEDTICSGGQTNLSISGANSYAWTPTSGLSNSNSSTAIASPNQSTIYTVQGISNGCIAYKQIKITVLPSLSEEIALGYSLDSCTNEFLFTNQTYKSRNCYWSFGDNFFDNTCSTKHSYSSSGLYNVTLTFIDTNGCNVDSLFTILVPDAKVEYSVPNVFTPNGDGINDIFKIETTNFCLPLQMLIYNRWGQLIYNKTLPSNWDGKYKNSPCKEGVYYYVLEGNNFKESGSFTLIR